MNQLEKEMKELEQALRAVLDACPNKSLPKFQFNVELRTVEEEGDDDSGTKRRERLVVSTRLPPLGEMLEPFKEAIKSGLEEGYVAAFIGSVEEPSVPLFKGDGNLDLRLENLGRTLTVHIPIYALRYVINALRQIDWANYAPD